MSTPAARLAASEFLLLTTYCRNGQPVPTPVFVVPHGDGLGAWTIDGSAKVRRIRADARVTLSKCDRVGTPLDDESFEGRARLLDVDGTQRVEAAIQHKYDLSAEQLKGIVLRIGADRQPVGIAIDVA
jgi:PPOX class probable F420-dependent enzyme